MKFEEYWSGVDKEPLRMELKPELVHEQVNTQKRNTFLAKMGAKDNGASVQPSSVSEPVVDESAKEEIEALTLKVEQLSDELSSSRQ
jgi:hypothetical protein